MNIAPKPYRNDFANQQGVILIFALIVLVALTLASVALIRSVDISTIAAGNLAYQRSALSATDRGVQTAINLFATGALQNILTTESNNAASAYCATIQPTDTRGIPLQLTDLEAKTTCSGVTAASFSLDDTQETVRYLIDRQCIATGTASASYCNQGGIQSATGGSSDSKHTGRVSPALFRVTVRVDGPKNTVSFSQVIIRP